MGLTFMGGETVAGICLPKNAPGLKFWGESILTQAKQGPASYSDYLMKANATNAVSTGTTPAGFTPSTAASSSGGSEAEKICAIGNSQCIVTLTKSLFDKEWKCSENCECWDEAKKSAKQSWIDPHVEVCQSLGDCGPKVTWLGSAGYKSGYNISVKDIKSSDSGGGGLFG